MIDMQWFYLNWSILIEVILAIALGFGMGFGVLIVSTILKNVYTPFGGIPPGKYEYVLSILVCIFISVLFTIIAICNVR